MLIGTALIGLSGYVFLAVIGRGRFEPAVTAALSATYLLSNVLGPGVFVAAEQETSRVVSDAIARGAAVRAFARRMAAVAGGLGVVTLLALAAAAPWLLEWVLDGWAGLVVALMITVAASAAVFYVRGSTGGQRRFGRYAATLVIDGGGRICGCVILVLAGNANPVAYALALCLGPALGWVCTSHGSGTPAVSTVPTVSAAPAAPSAPPVSATPAAPSAAPVSAAPGTPAAPAVPTAHPVPVVDAGDVPTVRPPTIPVLVRDVGWLLVASVLAMGLANLAPVIVTGMLPGDPAVAAGFAAAVVLTRIPLLLMAPIQALLLPRMTAAAAAGDRGQLRRDVGLGLAAIAGIGLIALAATAVAGSFVISLLFGADRDTTSTAALVLLTASALLFMGVQLLQPALVAIRRHRALMLAWIAGAVAFGLCFAIPSTPVNCGVLAQLAGPLVTLTIQLTVLRCYLRGRADPGR